MVTTFILGAGASRNYGYPLGSELKNNILAQLNRNGGAIYKGLSAAGNSDSQISEFRNSLFRADYETIDQFVGAQKRNPQIQQICKQAIVLSIAGCEDETRLFNTGWHWYKRLIDFLRLKPALLRRDNLGVITFNYDRSLEHYLYETVSRGGGDFSESYQNDFFQDNFLHVHGSVGPLSWQQEGREYGAPIVAHDIRRHAENILTPDEETGMPSEWRERLLKSDVVAFIGFGFHAKNMAKIGFDDLVNQSSAKILVTSYQLDDAKIQALNQHPAITCVNLDSNNFVGQYLDNHDRLDTWLQLWRKGRNP